MLSINRALQNSKIYNKLKTGNLKNEIIYFCSAKSKVDSCLKIHRITPENPNCYLLTINMSSSDSEEIKRTLCGKEADSYLFNRFMNYEKVIKEFEITEEELGNDMGLMGAVYNRIAIKDLK